MPEIRKHAVVSAKVRIDDIDWAECARIGLTERERRLLPYFADIEGHTIYYMMELLKLPPARDADTVAFATMWNYEEYFHSAAFSKMLEVCGYPLEKNRVEQVRANVTFRNKLEDFVQVCLSRMFPRSFVALWMMWGATQEMMTARGYLELAQSTNNPGLKKLCTRIAKQERRHFAWYYNSARERLIESRFSQKFARKIFERAWTPVGQGVKTPTEVDQMFVDLFPGPLLWQVAREMDEKFAALPGMEGFDVVTRYARSKRMPMGDDPALLPVEHLAPFVDEAIDNERQQRVG
jgi:rubrerythrin